MNKQQAKGTNSTISTLFFLCNLNSFVCNKKCFLDNLNSFICNINDFLDNLNSFISNKNGFLYDSTVLFVTLLYSVTICRRHVWIQLLWRISLNPEENFWYFWRKRSKCFGRWFLEVGYCTFQSRGYICKERIAYHPL